MKRILVLVALVLLVAPSAGAKRFVPGTVESRDGDLWLGAAQVTSGAADDSWPDFSPDRRRIAFSRQEPGERGASIWIVRSDGGGLTRLTAARDRVDVMPAWSFDGAQIAFARGPLTGGSFDVYTVDARAGGAAKPLATGPAEQVAPRWRIDGSVVSTEIGADGVWPEKTKDSGTPATGPRELLPDLEQRLPSGLVLSRFDDGWRLGFISKVDNVGRGPLHIRAARPTRRAPMIASQLVHLSDGSTRTYPRIGMLHYTVAPPHLHWHLMRFDRFALRRADDFSLVVSDRKIGFCLADHWGLAAARVQGFSGPRYLGNCGQGDPGLLRVEQGTSIGYTDRYPANFHGQNLPLAGVPAGDYVLVHSTNDDGRIEELDYTNNVASLRLRLTWRRGLPTVVVLRRCPRTDRC